MTRFAVAGTVLALALGGVSLADEKALKELEGTYKVTAGEKGGTPAAKELVENMTFTFKGDEVLIRFPDGEKKAKVKVDPAAKPAAMDIAPTDGPEKGRTFPGIYKLDGGELTLVFFEKGTERPKDFTSANDATLIRLKKAAK